MSRRSRLKNKSMVLECVDGEPNLTQRWWSSVEQLEAYNELMKQHRLESLRIAREEKINKIFEDEN